MNKKDKERGVIKGTEGWLEGNEMAIFGGTVDPPAGSFPDDTRCPKCWYLRVLLHSHGDIALECPNCGWCKTVAEAEAERKNKERGYETCNCVGCM